MGFVYSCALLTSGAVYCWGDNTYGQLGTGKRVNSLIPTAVIGLGEGAMSNYDLPNTTIAYAFSWLITMALLAHALAW